MKKDTPPLSKEAQDFCPGLYRHYKGDLYRAMFVARNSENRGEECVVYQSLLKGFIWYRPLGMFLETIEKDGDSVPRFKRIGD